MEYIIKNDWNLKDVRNIDNPYSNSTHPHKHLFFQVDMVNNTSNLDRPFDIDSAPSRLATDDAPNQHVTLRAALRAQVAEEDEGERFFSQRRGTKSLGYFQRLYQAKLANAAVESMLKRYRVDYASSNFCVPNDGDNLSWTIDRHFIDLMVCVGSGLGLGPMIPNQYTLHTFNVGGFEKGYLYCSCLVN